MWVQSKRIAELERKLDGLSMMFLAKLKALENLLIVMADERGGEAEKILREMRETLEKWKGIGGLKGK